MPGRANHIPNPEPPIWLSELLNTLRLAGVDSAAIGSAALALARGVPLPPGRACTIVTWSGDRAAAKAIITAADTPHRVEVQCAESPTDGEDLDVEQAACDWVADVPIRAWTLAVDADGQVHDPFDALQAIDDGRLILSQEPRSYLSRDAARILVVGAWAAHTGLRPGAEIVRAAQRESGHVLGLDRAIWRRHFNNLLLGRRASVGLQFLFEARALKLMLPEICAMVGFHETCLPVHHKDIWDHTLQVVDKCPQNLAVRWTALMHDTGKVWTRTINGRGRVHFFRHEEMGASLMVGVAARFGLEPALAARVEYIIANHARANVYSTEWTDSAVRRLVRDMGDALDDVIAFSQSDYTTKRAWRIKEVRTLAAELRVRIGQIIEDDARVPPLPKGFGLLVMAHTGRAGGPWLGQIQRWLEDEVEEGAIEAGLKAESYLSYVTQTRPELLTAGTAPDAGKTA